MTMVTTMTLHLLNIFFTAILLVLGTTLRHILIQCLNIDGMPRLPVWIEENLVDSFERYIACLWVEEIDDRNECGLFDVSDVT